ncbi:WXG100 family type VII secretion target [Micromonospora sp. HSS6-12]|uniref:WXG100 family type VII secretion target n=2 Tax=Micromonospora thermarum TaxID=2720024 RepID=A0ABX0Z587_9ACTN|nr:WXG100 family type VII secretion target [Micromonospora thermarum]
MAGQPGQIEGVAAQWTALKGIVDDLRRDLKGDLEKLANTWTGEAGQEFQRRLGFVATYAESLGEGMADVSRGLTLMADHLRTAKEQAESPAETDDHDQAMSGAAKGAVFGVPGMVVGGLLGHQQDKAEQEKAHQRMVNVVSELAAGYDLSAYGRLVPPPPPPPDTPGSVNRDSTAPRSGPAVGTPTASELSARTGGATASTPDRASGGPTSGTGGTATPTGGGAPGTGTLGAAPVGGTSLAGADPLLGGALAGGVAGLAALGRGGGATATPGTGPGLTFGTPGGTPAGGIVGTGAPDSRSATGIGRSADGRRGEGSGRDAATRQGTAASRVPGDRAVGGIGRTDAGRAAAAGTRPGLLGAGHGSDDEPTDGRLTWLTEDEMVWRDGPEGAPPVLGN